MGLILFIVIEARRRRAKAGIRAYYTPFSSPKYRAPNLLLVLNANDPRRQDAFWLGADLAVEIVSADRPKRDTEEKPRDYAEAQSPKCWIVNPLDETIAVLRLDGDAYTEHALFHRGQVAASALLDSFRIALTMIVAWLPRELRLARKSSGPLGLPGAPYRSIRLSLRHWP